MRNRAVILIIMSLSIVAAVVYSRAIVVFISAIFFNRVYDIRDVCIKDVCYAIVYESHLSLSSNVISYFFNNTTLPVPAINKNYVLFDTDYRFCVVPKEHDRFELISRSEPIENNIKEKVDVIVLDGSLPCSVGPYK